ncbi:hypothetical protein SIN8267_01318 [Sinobacterium norvegicum]|uniref:Uncharacterized protein n=1 Tax=Sinobacterium norvegicum TaxID=1641715 RepID=A0ABN8EG16_9GAMM|nr:DUF333 domain-containing protein [Sinobacterium norvegicum]CAH0991216.1 hypothetical protein SIN8267_01318 [Sinobacterium norvegicum]
MKKNLRSVLVFTVLFAALAAVFFDDDRALRCDDVSAVEQMFKDGHGDEYPVCVFEGNRQCALIAVQKGHCQPPGRKVSGYYNESARYCVIHGGHYIEMPGVNGSTLGECEFSNGRHIDADTLYKRSIKSYFSN